MKRTKFTLLALVLCVLVAFTSCGNKVDEEVQRYIDFTEAYKLAGSLSSLAGSANSYNTGEADLTKVSLDTSSSSSSFASYLQSLIGKKYTGYNADVKQYLSVNVTLKEITSGTATYNKTENSSNTKASINNLSVTYSYETYYTTYDGSTSSTTKVGSGEVTYTLSGSISSETGSYSATGLSENGKAYSDLTVTASNGTYSGTYGGAEVNSKLLAKFFTN